MLFLINTKECFLNLNLKNNFSFKIIKRKKGQLSKPLPHKSIIVEEEDAGTLSDYFDAASNINVKKGSEI